MLWLRRKSSWLLLAAVIVVSLVARNGLVSTAQVRGSAESGAAQSRDDANAGNLSGKASAAPGATTVAAPVAVTVASVVEQPRRTRIRVVGTLRGFDEIEVSAEVDGRVRQILHDVGDLVTADEPLLLIDDADYRLAEQEIARSLELELAKLGLSELPGPEFEVATLPAVSRAKVIEKNAATVLQRYERLIGQQAISQDEYDRAELALQTAKLDVQQQMLDVQQSLAAVRHRAATLEIARKRLHDTRVVVPRLNLLAGQPAQDAINLVSSNMAAAPLAQAGPPTSSTSGGTLPLTVAQRLVSEGEIVRAAQPTQLFRLIVEDPLKLEAVVPERYAGHLRVGQTVELTVEAFPGRVFQAQIARVSPLVDQASRTFQIEANVPNPQRLLKAGTFATANVLTGESRPVLLVPEEAIVRFAGVSRLFVAQGENAKSVSVEVGEAAEVAGEAGRWMTVFGPLAAGERVVTSGQAQLVDGSAIRLRMARAATGNSATARTLAPNGEAKD